MLWKLMRGAMATKVLGAALIAGMFVGWAYATPEAANWTRGVFNEDEAQRTKAIAGMRSMGPAGLAELLAIRDQLTAPRQVAIAANPDETAKLAETIAKLDKAIDQVAGQKDASISRLFWYTDLDAAKAAAKSSGKPILSLRMLGNLTEDCSCANSRFFRTALYSNANVSKYLRENFILHWKSVRPVPVVTVDFGDGRKMTRTVTGNSIHYMLDGEGRVVDGLPGLYGPTAFMRWLKAAGDLATNSAAMRSEQMEQVRTDFHRNRIAFIEQDWTRDLERIAPEVAKSAIEAALAKAAVDSATQGGPAPQATARAVPAAAAARRAGAKTAVEAPIIRQIAGAAQLDRVTDDELWKKIAALHADDAKLDNASVALIRRQNPPTAAQAARVAISKSRVEDPIVRLVAKFETSIALDTVKNEYTLHRQLHAWFVDRSAPADVESLNERVYAQLFLTPSSDPWLGLAPADTYSALDNNGVAAKK